MSAFTSGVYGKHPGQADFLRASAGEFAQAGLDRWFEEATEALRRERLTLPGGPTAFLLPGSAPDAMFAGVFVASQDAVGRSFPLIFFAPLAPEPAGTELSALPDLCGGFLEAAAALAREAALLTPAEVAARAQALPAPAGPVVPDQSVLAHHLAESLMTVLGGTPGALGYAVQTCLGACDQARKTAGGSASAAITVDAPTPTGAALQFWLELMAPRLGDLRPSLLWNVGPGGRLLAALGPPPPAFLSYLANPQHRATRFWPLRTEVIAAVDGTMKGLSPEQHRVVGDAGSSLAALLAAFS
jgi:type VI secretion system ImpM family protein